MEKKKKGFEFSIDPLNAWVQLGAIVIGGWVIFTMVSSLVGIIIFIGGLPSWFIYHFYINRQINYWEVKEDEQ